MSHAFAANDDAAKSALNAIHNGANPTSHPTDIGTETHKVTSGGGGVSAHHGKIGKINRLFRSSNDDSGSSAIDSIPVIQPLNVTQANATATVTIPVCDGVRGGPCLDKTTGQIVP